MGAAKKRKDSITSNLEEITNGYNTLIYDALEKGEINQLPSTVEERLYILEGLLSRKEGVDSEAIKKFRLVYQIEINQRDRQKRSELQEKFVDMENLSEQERRELAVKEVYRILSTEEFEKAIQNQIKQSYDNAYLDPNPKIKEIRVGGEYRGIVSKSVSFFDIVNLYKDIMQHEFINSTVSRDEQFVIRNFFAFFCSTQATSSSITKSISKFTKNIFGFKNTEFGELKLLTGLHTEYSISIIQAINPDGVSKELMKMEPFTKQEYDKNIKNSESIRFLTSKCLINFFEVDKYEFSYNKDSLVEFISNLQAFITQFGGHVLPKEIKSDVITNETNAELQIEDYMFCDFQQLIQARQSISSEENNSGEKHFYNPQLAQELDQLIQSRYEQMAERYEILRKEKPELSQGELLISLGKIYEIKFIGVNNQPNTFGNGVLLRVEPEFRALTFFDKFSNITFSRQAKENYNRLNHNGTRSIAERIENILDVISDAGNVAAFIEKVSRNEVLGYGWHKGEGKYLNCILFDLPQGERMVVNMLGDVIYIGNYHDDKK
jgi:hypothetical protein